MWLQLFLLTLGLSFFYIIWRRRRKRMKKICWTIKSNSFRSHSEQIIIIQYPHTYIMIYTKIWDFSSFMQCLKKIHKSIALKLKVMWSFRQVETVYRMHFSLWIDLFFFFCLNNTWHSEFWGLLAAMPWEWHEKATSVLADFSITYSPTCTIVMVILICNLGTSEWLIKKLCLTHQF